MALGDSEEERAVSSIGEYASCLYGWDQRPGRCSSHTFVRPEVHDVAGRRLAHRRMLSGSPGHSVMVGMKVRLSLTYTLDSGKGKADSPALPGSFDYPIASRANSGRTTFP